MRVARTTTSSRARIGADSGETSSPCSARCMAAVPSSANASSATTTRVGGCVTIAAMVTPTTPDTSADDAARCARAFPGDDADDEPGEHEERADRRVRGHTVTSGASSAKRLSPMPRTPRSSFTDVKPPRRCRSARIDCA